MSTVLEKHPNKDEICEICVFEHEEIKETVFTFSDENFATAIRNRWQEICTKT